MIFGASEALPKNSRLLMASPNTSRARLAAFEAIRGETKPENRPSRRMWGLMEAQRRPTDLALWIDRVVCAEALWLWRTASLRS